MRGDVLLAWFLLIKNVDVDHHLRRSLAGRPWYPWRRMMNSYVKNLVDKRKIVVDIDAVKDAALLQIEGVQLLIQVIGIHIYVKCRVGKSCNVGSIFARNFVIVATVHPALKLFSLIFLVHVGRPQFLRQSLVEHPFLRAHIPAPFLSHVVILRLMIAISGIALLVLFLLQKNVWGVM